MKVQEAANILGLSPLRVRQLISNGRIQAVKHGRDWDITPSSVSNFIPLGAGRRLSPLRAWGAIAALAGHRAEWLTADARSKAKKHARKLLNSNPRHIAGVLSARYEQVYVYVHPSSLPRLAQASIAAGLSGAHLLNSDLVLSGAQDSLAYIDAAGWIKFQEQHGVHFDWEEKNAEVRIAPDARIVAAMREDEAFHRASVAVDLLQSNEPRVSDAGINYLRGLAGV